MAEAMVLSSSLSGGTLPFWSGGLTALTGASDQRFLLRFFPAGGNNDDDGNDAVDDEVDDEVTGTVA